MLAGGYVVGRTPQLHMTYLMWKHGVGFRVGTSRTYTNGQAKAMFGPAMRCNGEGGRGVGDRHPCDTRRKLGCTKQSGALRAPTLPFKERTSACSRDRSLVGDQALIDRLFATLDTEKAGYSLLADEDLSFDYPHRGERSHGHRIRSLRGVDSR